MILYGPTTALIVVDVQNDFADPSGSLYVSEGEEVIPVINLESERARTAGSIVIYTQDWHPPSTPHFEKDGGIWPVHCVRETWGAGFHPSLVVDGSVIRKGTSGEDGYSGFSVRDPATGQRGETELGSLLRSQGITQVVAVGLATDYCVKETALDAMRLGFRTKVIASAIHAVNLDPGDGAFAISQMSDVGVEIV